MLQLVGRVICRDCIESGCCYLKYHVCFLLANLTTGYFLILHVAPSIAIKCRLTGESGLGLPRTPCYMNQLIKIRKTGANIL